MTIKHLKIFLTVYKYKSITKAARELHMAQPAVTRSIKELERYYEVSLFERINHRLYRRGCADELYARATHIIAAVEDLDCLIGRHEMDKELRIGATMTVGNFVLPRLVSEFQREDGQAKVRVFVSKSADIQQKILDNELDLAIVEENVSSSYLEEEYLCTDRMCLIFPKGHPLSQKKKIYMRNLLDFPILLREKGSANRAALDHIFDRHEISPKPLWESASSQALINAVAEGIGISILPEKLVRRDLEEGRIVSQRVEDEQFQRNIYVVWHRQKHMSEALEQFKALCIKRVREEK